MSISPLLEPASHLYTVSELTREIRSLLEGGFSHVWVEGEVSNFRRHVSGHTYFTLKDEKAQIRCALFRGPAAALAAPLLEGGLEGRRVRAAGRISVYERSGEYQLIVSHLEVAGAGLLQLALEQLKARLQAEGLFDPARKRPLPRFPEVIGVVTSPTGAVIRDIITIVGRRYPLARIVLSPVRVQGEGAGEEIAGAIADLNRWGVPDVLIVGRGGGSLEDLWAFNEEIVVRAIAASTIPVISAVGHEVDVTLADLAADVRAPTPSAAAETVVPDRRELLRLLEGTWGALRASLRRHLGRWQERLGALAAHYGLRRAEALLRDNAQTLDRLSERARSALLAGLSGRRARLGAAAAALGALSPLATLGRGYALASHLPSGRMLRDSRALAVGDAVRVQLARGAFRGEVTEVEE